MPISDGMGLVFSVTGYSDTIVISFTACYEQIPDPEVFAQCLRDSFQEYLALVRKGAPLKVGVAVEPVPLPKPVRKPVRKAKPKPVAKTVAKAHGRARSARKLAA